MPSPAVVLCFTLRGTCWPDGFALVPRRSEDGPVAHVSCVSDQREADVMTSEQRLTQVFIELADALVEEFDALDFLSTLTERSVELLRADAAGVILDDMRGNLHVVASTSDQAQVLELFELQND